MAALGPLSGATAEMPDFNRDIRPILSDKCFACHGPDSGHREAGLRLDTAEGATEWAVVPGAPDDSEVLARVSAESEDLVMPPPGYGKDRLTADEVRLVREWIAAGAEYAPHWAYLPPQRPTLPEVEHRGWDANPIDRLLLTRMTRSDVEPSPQADRRVLVRRLYLDLLGLPPTPDQVQAFLDDNRPDAYEQLVDALLASDAYGERMASWWFDLVRFADTVGYHGDQDQHILPYRDYVIWAFNTNLPFDQFTIEQLAGDLLPNPTMWQRVASGYNRLLQTSHEGGIQDGEYLAKHQADRVRNVSEVWLAASMGCAECHDHKFDPFSQRDFYRLGAFFADVDHYGSFVPVSNNDTPTQRPPEMLAWTLPIYERQVVVEAEIEGLVNSRSKVTEKQWSERQGKLKELRTELVELQSRHVPTMVTVAREPREVRVLPRGNWMDNSGEVVSPATPQSLPQIEDRGRRLNRLDLARWLVDGQNPLTARVVAARLWSRYFGDGLTQNLIDFGSQGGAPCNPELLDWIATEFVASGWDTKQLIRLMVTSSAYRQSSAPRPDLAAVDPKNELFARQASPRLEAEQIRDLALSVGGLLVDRVGGGFAYPYQPEGYYSALNFPERKYHESTGDQQYRRAVYTHWQRQFLHPWLLAFDAPTREECTAQRSVSNTPSAALVLLNDPCFVEAAQGLASRGLSEELTGDPQRVEWLWREVLSRPPSEDEAAEAVRLLGRHRKSFASAPDAAAAVITRPRAADGERAGQAGVAPAEAAAWTSLCRVLLNLHETIYRP